MGLSKLKQQYEKLGQEIKRLETVETIVVKIPTLPKELSIFNPNLKMSWDEAVDFAIDRGMRLPTRLELQAIALNADPQLDGIKAVWSSFVRPKHQGFAWYVNISNGHTYDNPKTGHISVLCVKRCL